MVTPSKNTDDGKLAFTCVDGDDRICDMGTRTNRKLDEVVDEDENAYVKDKTVACTLDVPVRILANATLRLNKAETRKCDLYFDDIAGYCGKIELSAAESKCNKLFVRDTPEETEWTTLRRGTWGATGSGADNIDDDRFSGTGVLIVRKDDFDVGFMLHVR